ncbi:unnamed protein product [Allacma fusca]|uniref:Uncharacterized protein n=1 Tax=Allacma fusca TaxID=39272 RepID=A0A8J2KHH0_9HEXA|nr:unnamed protein product [Allacma fusca]
MYGSQAPLFLTLLIIICTYVGGAIGQGVVVVQDNGRGVGVQAISWTSCGGDATVGSLNLDGYPNAG